MAAIGDRAPGLTPSHPVWPSPERNLTVPAGTVDQQSEWDLVVVRGRRNGLEQFINPEDVALDPLYAAL